MNILRRKSLWVGFVVLLILLAAIFAFSSYFSEPRYQGRRLSHWLAENHDRYSPESQEALRAIGSNAVPTLLKMLQLEEPFSLRGVFEKLRVPIELIKDDSERNRVRNMALRGFHFIGVAGAPAIPTLLPLLTNRNAYTASEVLQCIGPPALAPVQQFLTHTNLDARRHAVHIILSITRRAPATLTNLLAHPDPIVRGETYLWLRSNELPAEFVLETLLKGLEDPDELAASRAAVAIRGSGLDATKALPRLHQLRQTTNALLATEITSTINHLNKLIRIEQYAPRPH